MRRLVASLLLLSCLAGCQSRSSYGECVGFNDADRDPKLTYKVSGYNVVLGAVFFGTVFAPALVFFTELYCPVGHK